MAAKEVIHFPFCAQGRLNSYFCSTLQRSELQDSVRFNARHREYKKNSLDGVRVYRDVHAVEDRRHVVGKAPNVRFFTSEEQHEWERQYPKPPGEAANEPPRRGGEQP